MAGAAIIGAALTTPATRTLSVFAGGLDITGDVKWNTVSLTDSGTNAKGTADMTIERAASALPEITDQAMLRVEDHTLAASPEVFRGFIRARTPGKDPLHPTLSIIADDLTSLLDDAFVPVELRQPETMQARIGFFWGQYAGRFLSGDLSFVASVGSTLPIQRFEAVSLRQAIEMTIAQASSTADYYVDMLGRLHVFVTETNNAPFAIDADAPGGGEIAPETMAVEFDSNQYANRVYVKGATPDASLFVQDDAAIAAANGLVRTVNIQAGDVTTAAMAQAMGNTYLSRIKDATPRGSFRTHSPNDGWRGGQNVTVTSADHNITAQTYRIARVTTRVLNPGTDFKRTYDVEFGGAKAGSGVDGQQPLIAGAAGGIYTLDQIGNSLVSAAAASETGAIGPVMRRWITSGLYNSDFIGPPPGPDAPIDDTTNPLPYWLTSIGVGASDITYTSVASSTVSGRSIRADLTGGTDTALKNLQQRGPIHGTAGGLAPYVVKAVVSNVGSSVSADVFAKLGVTYNKVGRLGSGGTMQYPTTGTTGTQNVTLATIGAGGTVVMTAIPNSGVLPNDAYFLNVSFAISRTTGTDLGTVEFSDIWLERYTVPRGCVATRATTQSITTATWTAVDFNVTDISDPFAFHDPASNSTRFVVPTGMDGLYELVGQVGFAATTARVEAGWAKNGAGAATPNAQDSILDRASGTSNTPRNQVTSYMELVAGDYVELMVFQNSGGALNYEANGWASVRLIGETV
jgi:hypothetical protein